MKFKGYLKRKRTSLREFISFVLKPKKNTVRFVKHLLPHRVYALGPSTNIAFCMFLKPGQKPQIQKFITPELAPGHAGILVENNILAFKTSFKN
jgi:hypothetical protein